MTWRTPWVQTVTEVGGLQCEFVALAPARLMRVKLLDKRLTSTRDECIGLRGAPKAAT